MFFSVFATAALAGSSLVAAAPVHPAPRDRPTGWTKWSLEEYDVYHLRYLALDCQDQHNTTFFEDCCHPMKSYDSLEDRQAYCTPNETAIASASARIAAQATATITSAAPQSTETADEEDDDAEYEWCSYESSVSSAVAAGETTVVETSSAPSATAAPDSSDDSEAWTSPSASAASSSWSQEDAQASPSPSPSPSPDFQNKNANPPQESTSTTQEWTSTSTSSTQEATSTTSTWEGPKETPSTTSSSEAAQETSDSPAANGNEVDTDFITGGMATFYGQSDGGNSVGACGNEYPDSAMIVAMSTKGPYYPDENAVSEYCGRTVEIRPAGEYAGQGNTVTAVVADACPTCENGNSIDLSYAVYDAIGIDRSVGTYPIEWKFV